MWPLHGPQNRRTADGLYALVVVLGGGSLVGRLLTGARGRLVTALTSSAVIALLALWLVVPG